MDHVYIISYSVIEKIKILTKMTKISFGKISG